MKKCEIAIVKMQVGKRNCGNAGVKIQVEKCKCENPSVEKQALRESINLKKIFDKFFVIFRNYFFFLQKI